MSSSARSHMLNLAALNTTADRWFFHINDLLSNIALWTDETELQETQTSGLTPDEFKRKVPEWYPKIYRTIATLTYGTNLDPEDLTQETFMKAYNRLDSYRSDSAPYTWLYQIAKNTCMDAMRKVKVRRKVKSWFSAFSSADESEENSYEPPSKELPDEAMDRQESIQLLRKAVAQLPEEQRSLIVFKDFEGLSYEKIAEIYELPEGTIKSRLFKARKQLKQKLEELGYQHENY